MPNTCEMSGHSLDAFAIVWSFFLSDPLLPEFLINYYSRACCPRKGYLVKWACENRNHANGAGA